MDTVWKSNLRKDIKVEFFLAVVEIILLYGSSSWTLTKDLTKKLDGTYTKMVQAGQNITWQ